MQNARTQPDGAQQIDRLDGCILTCGVAVVGDHDLVRILPHEPALIGCQRRAERSNDIFKACLMHRNDIHIALCEDQPFGL